MLITISGLPGSGTTTVSRLVASALHLDRVPGGEVFRQLAAESGMSLAEFRNKGRFGCPKDYEVFRAHIEPLLLRVHSARAHRGRLPGMDEVSRKRLQQITDLRTKLEAAIREEAYESAARLRDEIQVLEAQPGRS